MKKIIIIRSIAFVLAFIGLPWLTLSQSAQDNFEGDGNITTWFGDNCGINTSFNNPFQESINMSATVLRYDDTGGQYANVRFDVSQSLDMSIHNAFKLKVYVPSSSLNGGQPHQVSLKLQNNILAEPWTTQTELIKPIELDVWQELIFDFENDNYINFDAGSSAPIQRTDLNRVVIQVNGENNTSQVVAYIDDIENTTNTPTDPVFDELVWSDEFNGSGAIDTNKWFHQTQIPDGVSWYNNEIQHYTNREDNSFQSSGNLNLVAKEETFTDQGQTKEYTSARLNSKFAFTYGRVEIRAKMPSGVGTWPALWMLGKNVSEPGAYWQTEGFGTTGWPACGEIDIIEHWGDNQNFVQSAIHTPSSSGNTVNKGGQTIATTSTEFHVYEMEWTSERIVFRVDGVQHYVYDPAVKDASTWPFDLPQYLIFNVAILPNIEMGFTQSTLEVDYIRVYQESTLSNTTLETVTEKKIKVFPNPVTNNVTILLNNTNEQQVTFQLSDINGRLISNNSYQIKNGRISYDTSILVSGLYFVKLFFADGTSSTQKLIKQ